MVIHNVAMVSANAIMANRPVRMKVKHVASISKTMTIIADNADLNAQIMKHAQAANAIAAVKMEVSVANSKRVAVTVNAAVAAKMEPSAEKMKCVAMTANATVETKMDSFVTHLKHVVLTAYAFATDLHVITMKNAEKATNATAGTQMDLSAEKMKHVAMTANAIAVAEMEASAEKMKHVAMTANAIAATKSAIQMKHVMYTSAVDVATGLLAARGINAKTVNALVKETTTHASPTKPVHGFAVPVVNIHGAKLVPTNVPAVKPIHAKMSKANILIIAITIPKRAKAIANASNTKIAQEQKHAQISVVTIR